MLYMLPVEVIFNACLVIAFGRTSFLSDIATTGHLIKNGFQLAYIFSITFFIDLLLFKQYVNPVPWR